MVRGSIVAFAGGRVVAVEDESTLRGKSILFHLSSAEAPAMIADERGAIIASLESRLDVDALRVI